MAKITVASKIETYLKTRKTPATAAQVVKIVGGNVSTVKRTLQFMATAGTVSRVAVKAKLGAGAGRPTTVGFTITK